MGYNSPSKIQEVVLPVILADPPQNVIAQSQSGTGKTATFAICMLNRLDVNLKQVQCIVVAPSYELALQIGNVIEKLGVFVHAKVRYAIKGRAVPPRDVLLEEHIIVGTPGTIHDFCVKRRVVDMKKLKVFVLDEADVMISNQGHGVISLRLKQDLSPQCQTLLFSATYSTEIASFAREIIDNPKVFSLRLEQTKKSAYWLKEKLCTLGIRAGLLSSDLDVHERTKVITEFRKGGTRAMVTTNLSSRGLDVEQVTMVVNYDLPIHYDTRLADTETYIHRIGRTGRFGKVGIAINLITTEEDMNLLTQIKDYYKVDIKLLHAENEEEIAKIEPNVKGDRMKGPDHRWDP